MFFSLSSFVSNSIPPHLNSFLFHVVLLLHSCHIHVGGGETETKTDRDTQREINREIDRKRQSVKFKCTYERKQSICLSQLISHSRWPVVPSFFLKLTKFQTHLWLNWFLMCIELAFEEDLFAGKESLENDQFQLDHPASIRWSSIGQLVEEPSWRNLYDC